MCTSAGIHAHAGRDKERVQKRVARKTIDAQISDKARIRQAPSLITATQRLDSKRVRIAEPIFRATAFSVYMRAKSLPSPQNLQKLAGALGVGAEELLPNHLESAIEEDNPSFELRVSTSAPTGAWVRVNRLVSLTTATKIAALLEADVIDQG